MQTDSGRLIIAPNGTSSALSIHHRDFPEIRAVAGSPREAATHLAQKLARALDSALTDWRRESINHALADVKAFVDQEG
jgi:hypothetical protein